MENTQVMLREQLRQSYAHTVTIIYFLMVSAAVCLIENKT